MFGFLLLIIVLLVLAHNLGAFGSLFFGELLCLSITKRANSVGGTGQFVDAVCDLASTDQRQDNTGAYNECQNEAVDSVPRRGPASLTGATVSVVEEVKSNELGDQSVFDREEDCGPCDCGGPNADCIALVAFVSAVPSKLQTPVDSAKEGDDLQKGGQQAYWDVKWRVKLTTAPYPTCRGSRTCRAASAVCSLNMKPEPVLCAWLISQAQ